jgi:peptidoglycan LD-endopeptidase CwlK
MTRFAFGNTSLARLATCHPDIQHALHAAMRHQLMDFTIIVGHRGQAEQDDAFRRGASKLRWPQSMHNTSPSLAVDIAPWPIRWGDNGSPTRLKDIGRFYKLAGIVLAASREHGIVLRWGGDWNMNGDVYDQTFDDLVHFELRNRDGSAIRRAA